LSVELGNKKKKKIEFFAGKQKKYPSCSEGGHHTGESLKKGRRLMEEKGRPLRQKVERERENKHTCRARGEGSLGRKSKRMCGWEN